MNFNLKMKFAILKPKFLTRLLIFYLIFSFFPIAETMANETAPAPELPQTPTLASSPALPSINAFGTPNPPDILENAEVSMPDIGFWQEKNPVPFRNAVPVNPSYAAIFSWPVRGRISSYFGFRGKRMHEGIDIPVPSGTPIQTAAEGVVAEARTFRGYGYTVIVDHQNGTKTLYAHCSTLAVRKGEKVENGQVIAYAGNTGRSTTSHVHFGVFIKGAFQNPMVYLKDPSQYQLASKP